MRTRPGFIASELLFDVGDCYDPLLLRESERLLRDYRFIARAEVTGSQQPDGRWRVLVVTQDEWTTKVSADVRPGGEPWLRRAAVTEENLLGTGILLGGFLRAQETERDLGARIELPRLGRTRFDTRLSIGRTRFGDFLDQSLSYPFLGEVSRLAARQAFLRVDTSFPYSVGAGPDAPPGAITDVLLPIAEQRFEMTLAGRIGRPGNLTVLGMGFSNETLEFPAFPGGVEVARDGSFGGTAFADSATAAAVRPQTLHSAGTHVNLLVGQRNVRFERFRGLDALRGTQDVPIGSTVSLTLGRTVAALSAGDDQPADLYTRLVLELSAAGPGLLLASAGGVEASQVYSGGEPGDGWKDVLAELAALVYWQPPALSHHTFFARAAGAGGWSVTQPFQLTLGGPAGVRGYDVDDFPGGRQVVLSVEDRIYLGWPFPRLLDLGVTLLADAGRVWAGDAPFGVGTGWLGTVGGGLRASFPSGSGGVARADLVWPVSAAGVGRRPLLRLSMTDPLGIVAGLADRQLARSRRLQVGPDLFTAHLR